MADYLTGWLIAKDPRKGRKLNGEFVAAGGDVEVALLRSAYEAALQLNGQTMISVTLRGGKDACKAENFVHKALKVGRDWFTVAEKRPIDGGWEELQLTVRVESRQEQPQETRDERAATCGCGSNRFSADVDPGMFSYAGTDPGLAPEASRAPHRCSGPPCGPGRHEP